MPKNFLNASVIVMTGALLLPVSPVFAAVPSYNLVWLGLGNTATATGSDAQDINNQNQIVGSTIQLTNTNNSIFTNWGHSTVWTPSAIPGQAWTLADEIANAAFQPCNPAVIPAGSVCPDVNDATAINDSSLVVGTANVPAPTSYFLPSGSGWDHSYYYDFANHGQVLPVPTTYGTAIGHYDYATDVNSAGTVIGYMDGAWTGSVWPTVGYLYSPGQTKVTTLATPTLADGSHPAIVYPKAVSDPDASGAVLVVGMGSESIVTPTATSYYYRPVLWQGGVGQEIAGFSLASSTQWSFAQGVNNHQQISGYTQDAADTSNTEYARLHDLAVNQTVTLGLGQGLHVNSSGSVAITNYQNYPVGGAFIFIPAAANSQTGQTCKLDAGTVPTLAATPNDHLDTANSVNDNGLIVGSGTHNGHAEAYVLVPTATVATAPTCNAVPYGGPVSPVNFAPTLPSGTQGTAYSATLTASGGAGQFTYTATGLPAGLGLAGSRISGTPSQAGIYSVTLTATDINAASVSVSTMLTIQAPVIAGGGSCTVPAGAKKGLNSQGKITAVSANLVTFKTSKGVTVTVNVPSCAKIQWNGGATAFAVGQVFEWNGYSSAATGNVAQQVTIN